MTLPIHLRALEPEDLEWVYALENTPDVAEVSADHVPVSRYAVQRYLSQQPATPLETGELRLVVCTGDDVVAGLIDLTSIDFYNAHAEVGIALIPSFRKQGVAQQALQAIEAKARQLALCVLTAHVPVHVASSVRLFQRAGYTLIGTLPQYYNGQNGREDVLLFLKEI